MTKVRDLTIGSVPKNLFLFAVPFFVAFFLNSLYSAIDLFFIGQFSDTYNIAAVSSGTTIMFAINSVIIGLASGGTVVIGQYFGAKDKNINKVVKTLIIYMIIVCCSVTIIMVALNVLIIDWMQIDDAAVNIARNYLFVLTLGIPLLTGYVVISAILRGLGNSFAPFVFIASAVVSNIGLDALFVIGLNMGSLGAAIATVIGEGVGFIVALGYLTIHKLPFKLEFGWKPDKSILKQIVKCGLPIAIQDGLVIISFAIILAAISVKGVNYTSAVGITDRVTSFGFVPLSAIANAISTATAQNMGAGKIYNVKKYLYWGTLFAVISGSIMGILCQVIPYQLASLFAKDSPEALEIASPYIRSTSLDIFICALVFPLNAVFIGSGKTIFAMAHNLGSTFIVRIPFALVLALATNASMYVIGLAYCASSIFSYIACLIYYFLKKWANLKSLSIPENERKLT